MINIPLLDRQLDFITDTSKCAVYIGGVGAGKTRVGCIWTLLQAFEGKIVIAMQPTGDAINRNLFPTYSDILARLGLIEDRDYIINKSLKVLRFINGIKGEIWMVSAEACESLVGMNAHVCWGDEVCSIKEKAFKIMIARCRMGGKGPNYWRLTGTPSSANPWVPELINKPSTKLFVQPTYGNIFLPEDYVDSLADSYGGVDSLYYQQEVLGKFVDFSTGIFETGKIVTVPRGYNNGVSKTYARIWDTATSTKTNADFTASVLLSKDLNNRVVIEDVTRWQGSFASLLSKYKATILNDPKGSIQYGLENTSASQVMKSVFDQDPFFANYHFSMIECTKDKLTRALPVTVAMSNGLVSMVEASWNKEFLAELKAFPKGNHDDMVDALSHSFNKLNTQPPRWMR